MSKKLPVVVAVHRINGKERMPGDIFVAANEKQHDELLGMGAVRLANEQEISVHEGLQKAGAKTAGGRGRKAAEQPEVVTDDATDATDETVTADDDATNATDETVAADDAADAIG
jgi:hypothetical protein